MQDLEIECHMLGIPVKTCHNEVAPNQFEVAPIFEETNLANDHNLLLMSVMREVARRHNFRVLLHEKPFKGVNGSGKHNNWSLGTDKGVLLFAPATNGHRLGANEAPPAIISIFMGKQISEILEKLAESTSDDVLNMSGKSGLKLDVAQIPEILMDNTDRNRTSPFAFTGNRFEFRAVGSSANCASAMIALNAAVAYQLQDFKKKVDALIANGKEKTQAILSVVKDLITESKDICFDGNGYSEEWKEEAKRRGLDCETSVPLIFDSYLKDDVVKMFEQTHVFTQVELQARNEVKWEIYTKKIQIEARVLGDLAINHIVPVATRYQSLLLDNVFKIKSLFPAEKSELIATQDMEVIEKIAFHLLTIKEKVHAMVEARKVANKIENEREKAIAYHDTVAPQLDDIRYHIDKLELMVDNEMWPLPKYRELLFIR